jgi:hypothetical protein
MSRQREGLAPPEKSDQLRPRANIFEDIDMATVAPKTFFSNLYDEPGTLARIDNALVFFGDNGDIITVEPSDVNFLVVLGECGVAQTQEIMDKVVHGGYAAVACNRQQEVR